jgi:hypothetical protein
MGQLYKKENRKYIPIAYDDFDGFPCDGIWLVKFENGREKSASCISRLTDLPDPFPFHNMMMDRDKLATFLVKQYEQPLSACEIATNVFKFLTELNKSQTVKFKKPKKFGKDKNN